jgi:recombinational DNA repair ATPase RecF
LNTLKGAIERGRQEKLELAMAKSKLEKLKALENAFLAARDSILQDLYNSISNRFELLYKQIHDEDENSFRAKITQKTAGLDIGVDFYGKGLHPPQAMHSDGHQDSMGLCLYLALYEQMHGDKVQFVALDDVVISIDYAHRRKIAELLADQFPETQFFITTHEAGWSNQLSATFGNTLGEFVQFFDWNVETGPTTSNQVNFIPKSSGGASLKLSSAETEG